LDWTSTNSVSIDGGGCQIYATFGLSGTQSAVTWGAPLGQRGSGASVRNLAVAGAFAVQNMSYCKDIFLSTASALIVQCDTVCSYNDFHIGSLDGGAGNGSALIFNQLNNSAWCNNNCFYGISMHGSWVGASTNPPQPCIWQANQNVQWAPGSWFSKCSFEGDNQTLLNVGKTFSCTFEKCYAEGSWVEGTGGSMEAFTWDCLPAKWSAWMADPRNIEYGIKQ
jgi:hypothetical protein